MGAIACARCDASQCRTCTNCQQHEAYDRHRGSYQQEEEVHMADESVVSLEYGFLAKFGRGSALNANGCHPSKSSSEPRAAKALYEAGALVPIRFAAGGRAKALLEEKYRLHEQPLGRGSYGEVLLAEHLRTGARRAVKSVSKAALRRYVQDVDTFVRREVDILRRLDHPNIIRPYEAFEDEDMVHLVLEVCNGGDLLERVTVSRQRLPEQEAALLLQQMLSAVQHLHLTGVVHRDIKPENILLDQPPPHGSAKLADFGWSNMMDDVKERMTFCGTADYLAPEMVRGEGHDQSLDMWEMGVLLYEMTVGKSPFAAAEQVDTCRNIVNCTLRYPQSLDKDCRDLISRLLQIKKDARLTAKEAKGHKFVTAFYGRPSAALAEARPSVQERHFRRDKEILNMELMRILKEISAANDKHLEVISETEKVAAQVKQAKQETASARRMRAELHQRISEQENLLQQKRRQA
mmetsp:Transcript_12871/g.29114  ORF Transcript_12871/g.29114 Transcript_12871/m.29114 type:complete len:464 (-) Transcript_12871:60-1451(-)